MTPEQIENWREILSNTYGPLALFLSVEDIELLQRRLNTEMDIENRKVERKAKKEKLKRKGLCSHGVAAKYCRACK